MPEENLPAISSNYYLRQTIVTVDNTRWFELLKPNPARWRWIAFVVTPTSVAVTAFPDTTVTRGLVIGNENTPIEVKFRDDPALCTGGVFACGLGFIGTDVFVWECLPVGY